MIPHMRLFTKTRNRWRHFMQVRSNPDFMHGDFEMFNRVWCSIESLYLTSGLRKNYAREVGIRSLPQYQISPNFFSSGAHLGEVEIEKSTITLKYATDAEGYWDVQVPVYVEKSSFKKSVDFSCLLDLNFMCIDFMNAILKVRTWRSQTIVWPSLYRDALGILGWGTCLPSS